MAVLYEAFDIADEALRDKTPVIPDIIPAEQEVGHVHHFVQEDGEHRLR